MLADRISEREYWHRRAAEVGRLVGEEWTSPRMMMAPAPNDPIDATTRPEALAASALAALTPEERAIVEEESRLLAAVHGALAARRAVRDAGRKVGVLSNELDLFNGPGFGAKLFILKLMHAIVDATYTGILKPDRRAYQAAADALGAPIERCLMVDDQPRNIAGALAAGMQAEWFDVTRPAETYARVLARLGIDAAESVG